MFFALGNFQTEAGAHTNCRTASKIKSTGTVLQRCVLCFISDLIYLETWVVRVGLILNFTINGTESKKARKTTSVGKKYSYFLKCVIFIVSCHWLPLFFLTYANRARKYITWVMLSDVLHKKVIRKKSIRYKCTPGFTSDEITAPKYA